MQAVNTMHKVNTINSIFIRDMNVFDETVPVALEISSSKLIPLLEMFRDNTKEKGNIIGGNCAFMFFSFLDIFIFIPQIQQSAIAFIYRQCPCISALLLYVELLKYNNFLRSGQ